MLGMKTRRSITPASSVRNSVNFARGSTSHSHWPGAAFLSPSHLCPHVSAALNGPAPVIWCTSHSTSSYAQKAAAV